jgi:hypothetical protein
MTPVLRRTLPADPLVEACLDTLRATDPSLRVQGAARSERRAPEGGENPLTLRVGRETVVFALRVTRTHLSYALAAGFTERGRAARRAPTLLFAPYVPAPIGRHLAEHGVSYADAAGNCHVMLARGRLLAHVEGKKPTRNASARSGGRAPGRQLLFAILAEPALLAEPVRTIAAAAGLGKSTAALHLEQLVTEGLIARTKAGLAVARPAELLDRWLLAYEQSVRPAWLIGRYRTPTADPEDLERDLEKAWGAQAWALGGGAAAWRMTRFYRGPDTVLHVAGLEREMLRPLRMLAADDGPITVLRTPGTLAYKGSAPHLAHPLLVYSEMVISSDVRMREAATEVRERFLKGLP